MAIKFKKPATGKPFKLAYNAGDVVTTLSKELETKLIEGGYAVPYEGESQEEVTKPEKGGKKA